MSLPAAAKYLLPILFLAAILRLALLDRFPTGITPDELHFVLNARAVYYRFTNMAADWSPLSLSPIPHESSSELPFLLLAPFVGPVPTNLFWARLPFVLVSLVSLFLVYRIVLILATPLLALLSALVFALNPYSIYVARTSFDAPLALLFFLLSLYLFLKLNRRRLFLVFIPLLLAFYTYIGTKVIWLPFVYLASFISFFHSRSRRPNLIIISLVSTLFYILWSVSTLNTSTRTSELWTPWSPQISSQVQLEKDQSLQNPLKNLLTNNFTVFARQFTFKYLNNFSPDILFLSGDHTFLVSLWKHGYFYSHEFILIILGVVYLLAHHRLLALTAIGFILLSPLPEAVRHDSIPAYAFHSILQYPFLYILAAAGSLYLIKTFKSKITAPLLVLVYLVSTVFFLDIYFFKYPVYQPEGFAFSRRVVSRIILEESKLGGRVVVLTREPDSLFRSYLFYTNLYQPSSFNQVKNVYANSRNPITFNNIIFTSDDRNYQPQKNDVLIVEKTLTDHQFAPSQLTVNHLGDAHALYSIYNSRLCQGQPLEPFSHHLNLFHLNIEHLPLSTFCTKFVNLTFN